jgi:biopolymer transport protein ExbD
MAMAGGSDDGEPMMEMNMTPLIDVLLVLLIMFIITIPIQTHAVKVDLPVNDPNNTVTIDPQKNKVVIDPAGQISWNGAPVDPVTLQQYLEQTTKIKPEPDRLITARTSSTRA